MRLSFSRAQRPHTIYVLKSFRDKDGKSTSRKIETLGSEEEIEKKYGCPDGLEWPRLMWRDLTRRRSAARRRR